MLLARLHGIISGVILPLSCLHTYTLLNLRPRALPGFGRAVDLGEAGAAVAKGGEIGEGTKGGLGLGKTGKTGSTPSGSFSAKPGGFEAPEEHEAHPSPLPKNYEPGGPSHNPSVIPIRQSEITPASPDPSLPSSPTRFPRKLIDYFWDTKDKFFQLTASKLAEERRGDRSLNEYLSVSEASFERAPKGKISTEVPAVTKAASGNTFWSKVMDKIRPQRSGTAAPTRPWTWLKSLGRKITNLQGGRKAPIPASTGGALSRQAGGGYVGSFQLNRILRELGEILDERSLNADTLVEEFLKKWISMRPADELGNPTVMKDMEKTGEDLKTLMLKLQENTEAKNNLIRFSDELKKWKPQHLSELSKALVTTRSKTALKTVENTKEELNKIKPEELERQFQPEIEEATNAFTTAEKKMIFGELSKDPSTSKEFRSHLDEALNLQALMEKKVKTDNTKAAINEFVAARAGQKATSESSKAIPREAPAGLTITDLLETLPEGNLARNFYIFKLVKGFEKLLEPLKKSAKEVMKRQIISGFKESHDTPEQLGYLQRTSSKFFQQLIQTKDNARLDTLFKKVYNTEQNPDQIIQSLKKQDVSGEPGTRNTAQLLDELKEEDLLTKYEYDTLTATLQTERKHYEYLLDTYSLKSNFIRRMGDKISYKLEAPLDSAQKEAILDNAADEIASQQLETLDLDSKRIYLDAKNYREGTSPFQQVTELYAEEHLQKRVDRRVLLPEIDVEEFKRAHFSNALIPIKPAQLTGRTAGSGSNNLALESEFLDALKIPRDKYKSYELLANDFHYPTFGKFPGETIKSEKLDGRYMALYDKPLRVRDERLKGTRFEYLSDTAITQLNQVARTFGESVTAWSQKSQIELQSRQAIQKLIQTLKPHEDVLIKILEPMISKTQPDR